MAKLFVIDPHPVTRLGIRRVLEQANHIVIGEAADAAGALAAIEAGDVDLVILTSSSAGAAIRMPHAAVLLFDDDVPSSLPPSIRAHVRKCADPSELCHAVDAILAGLRSAPTAASSRHAHLSPRERQITSMILEGRRPKEIGQSLGVSPKTVSTHRTRIFNKLGLDGDVALVRYALQHGMV